MARLRHWLLVACFVVGLGAALVVMRLDARVRSEARSLPAPGSL